MAVLMLPSVGMIYRFSFIDGYTFHNGVYKVAKVMTYDEYIADGHDILDDFFVPNSKGESDLNEVYAEVTTSKILKLIDPDGLDESDTEYYVPLNFIKETPDMNVEKYYKFGIVVDAGITKDPKTLTFMRDILTEAVEASFGITPQVDFITLHEKWLSQSEYQEILDARDQSKLKVINYYSENQKLQKQISSTNTKLKEYEKLILNLQAQLDALRDESDDDES